MPLKLPDKATWEKWVRENHPEWRKNLQSVRKCGIMKAVQESVDQGRGKPNKG